MQKYHDMSDISTFYCYVGIGIRYMALPVFLEVNCSQLFGEFYSMLTRIWTKAVFLTVQENRQKNSFLANALLQVLVPGGHRGNIQKYFCDEKVV